jgi:carbon monoxide dehydrogenase subunit G
MEIIGQQIIAAPRDAVWRALNDPAILKQCLPGCESVEQTSPEEFHVVIKATIGPLRARFAGVLRMADVKAPQSCVMHFEGQGGVVGFGKGTSSVSLREIPEGTELSYKSQAQVGGKLAQVGSRLIDSVAKKMADDFFKALRQQLAPSAEPKPATVPGKTAQAAPEKKADDRAGSDAASPATIMVPGWWLAVALVLGAALAIAGARLIH